MQLVRNHAQSQCKMPVERVCIYLAFYFKDMPPPLTNITLGLSPYTQHTTHSIRQFKNLIVDIHNTASTVYKQQTRAPTALYWHWISAIIQRWSVSGAHNTTQQRARFPPPRHLTAHTSLRHPHTHTQMYCKHACALSHEMFWQNVEHTRVQGTHAMPIYASICGTTHKYHIISKVSRVIVTNL